MLRDQLLRDVANLSSADGAAVWARRILPAKNTLHEADARQVEEAFEAKLTVISGPSNGVSGSDRHDEPQAQPTNEDVGPARLAVTGQPAEGIDKDVLAHPEPRRVRDKDHLRPHPPDDARVCATPTAIQI